MVFKMSRVFDILRKNFIAETKKAEEIPPPYRFLWVEMLPHTLLHCCLIVFIHMIQQYNALLYGAG